MTEIYAAGGIYGVEPDAEFKFVSPSGKDSLPYVSKEGIDSSLHRLTQHHSHYYRIDMDRGLAYCVTINHECDGPVGAPKIVKLSAAQKTAITQALEGIK